MDMDDYIPWIHSKQTNHTNSYGNRKTYNGGGAGCNHNKKSSSSNYYYNNNNNNYNRTPIYKQQPKHIEFNLSSISIEEYHESIDPAFDDYKLRFRYKYLEEGISIFLNENRCKIYVPVDNIEAISKIQSNVIVLTLKKDKDPASSVNYSSKEGYLKDDPIRDNLYKTTSISMIVQESTPQQVIDMVGLHIHYLVNRNNKGITRTNNSDWGRSNAIPSLSMKDGKLLLKCHVGADIRILSFIQPIRYDVIKQKIQAAFEIAKITKLKYKDEEGEFITIMNNADFDTASKLYLKENKLEIWIVE